MILHVNDDGSITQEKLEDALNNETPVDTQQLTKEIPTFHPNPRFNQFDTEFQQFEKFETSLKAISNKQMDCKDVDIPSIFQQPDEIPTHCSKQRRVSTLQIPKIFYNQSSRASTQDIVYWRFRPHKLSSSQRHWPPK